MNVLWIMLVKTRGIKNFNVETWMLFVSPIKISSCAREEAVTTMRSLAAITTHGLEGFFPEGDQPFQPPSIPPLRGPTVTRVRNSVPLPRRGFCGLSHGPQTKLHPQIEI